MKKPDKERGLHQLIHAIEEAKREGRTLLKKGCADGKRTADRPRPPATPNPIPGGEDGVPSLAEAKEQKAGLKDAEEGIQEAIAIAARAIHSGQEERPVMCHIYATKNEAHVIRVDTGEVVLRRPLTPEERQGRLSILEPKE
jgi:hypothetical protein